MIDLPSRKKVIREFQKKGGKIAAVLPIRYPRELFRAFGFLPVEVWGPPHADVTLGGSHLQSYTCDIVRNAVSFLLSGGLDRTDLILVPHTCDSLQGMGSVLLDFVHPKQKVLTLYHPRGVRKADFDFLTEELKRLCGELSGWTGGEPPPGAFWEAIYREETADRALARLYRDRELLGLSDREFYRIVRSREFLPAEDFIENEKKLARREKRSTSGVPILLSGIVPEPMDLFDEIETMGARVVADDLACGTRRLYKSGHSEDPFVRMAERLFSAPPDPTRGSPISERADHLKNLIRKSGAKGVLIYDVKFCEPELFDVPLLRKKLEAEGTPVNYVEFEMGKILSQQTLTRIEAFIEMIG
ncbi:(R)-2-hydroxyglutaryl-CoA dehydratase subunit beta [bacterium BMS3Abin05]|nr:(R)-2-hydroxyglutaryl-CoA dehydratase subunit beta [bacterium BMS3Abin05]